MMSSAAITPGSTGSTVRGYLEVGILSSDDAREDYYLEGGQAKAEFFGGALERLGVSEVYNSEDFDRLFHGQDKQGNQITQADPEKRVPGWDLTFSAPKSVSLMWANSHLETQRKIELAHDKAVREALSYLERNVSIVNVGKGKKGPDGRVEVKTERGKIAAALFRHGTSRAQDPDIHTHALLYNIALRADGKLMSLNSKDWYQRIKEIGAVYRIALANNMQNLGFAVEHDKQSFRVYGADPDHERDSSKRRKEIEAKLRDMKASGSKVTTLITLITREGKEDVPLDVLREKWRGIARLYQFNADGIELLRNLDYNTLSNSDDVKDKMKYGNIVSPGTPDFSEMLYKMTEFESALKPEAAKLTVLQALQGRLPVDQAEKYIDRFFSDENENLIHLKHDGEHYVSSREIYAIERENLKMAHELYQTDHKAVSDQSFDKGMKKFSEGKDFELSDEQYAAVKHITQESGALALVEGLAGTGKSTALEAAMHIWQNQGLNVRGATPQGTQAESLQQASGIPSMTIHKLLLHNKPFIDRKGREREPTDPITAKDVIVVDEAGTIDSRTMNQLQKAVQKAGAKLVAIGDTLQKQPVQAGGSLYALKREIDKVDLVDIRRQKNELTRDTVSDMLDGKPGIALQRLLLNERLTIPKDHETAIKETVNHWFNYASMTSMHKTIMIANTNDEVRDLNAVARQRLAEEGMIKAHTGTVISITDRTGRGLGQKAFAEGDFILFRKNDSKIDVKNGERAEITHIEFPTEGGVKITAKGLTDDDGEKKEIEFNTKEYNHFNYGYAVTTDGAQGVSINHAAILISGGVQDFHAAYVEVSRVKYDINVVIPEKKDLEDAILNGPPTKEMLDYANDLLRRLELPKVDFSEKKFSEVRDFLNRYAARQLNGKKKEEEDHGDYIAEPLLVIKDVIESMREKRFKKTTLDFEVSDTPFWYKSPAQEETSSEAKQGADLAFPDSVSQGDWEAYTQSASSQGQMHGATPSGSNEKSNSAWDSALVKRVFNENLSDIMSALVTAKHSSEHSIPGKMEAWGANFSITLNIDPNNEHYGKVTDSERKYDGDLLGYFGMMTGRSEEDAFEALARRLTESGLHRKSAALINGPPTEKMIEYATSIAQEKKLPAEDFGQQRFKEVRKFLNEHSPTRIDGNSKKGRLRDPLAFIQYQIKSMTQESDQEIEADRQRAANAHASADRGAAKNHAQAEQEDLSELPPTPPPEFEQEMPPADYDAYAGYADMTSPGEFDGGQDAPPSDWLDYSNAVPASPVLSSVAPQTLPENTKHEPKTTSTGNVQNKNKQKTKTHRKQKTKPREKGRAFWDREQVTELLMRNPDTVISALVDENRSTKHSKPGQYDAWGKNGSIKLITDQSHKHYGKVSDFERGYSGDLIGYFGRMTGRDWYSALDELARSLNMDAVAQQRAMLSESEKRKLKAKQEQRRQEAERAERQELEKRIKRAQRIWSKTQPLANTLAQKYLQKIRGIDLELNTQDVRFLPNAKEYYKDSDGKLKASYSPALVVAARNANNEITSVQQIYLNPKTAEKNSNAKVPKRSIGPLKGAAVLMHSGESNEVILAEGPETGASVAQGRPEAKVYVSLGNNISWGGMAHLAKLHKTDTIIFAADNDGGVDAATYKNLKQAAEELHKSGIKVKVAMPPMLPGKDKTDFNHILKEKGTEAVRQQFESAKPLTVDKAREHDNSMSR